MFETAQAPSDSLQELLCYEDSKFPHGALQLLSSASVHVA